jgi:hypothetical protein
VGQRERQVLLDELLDVRAPNILGLLELDDAQNLLRISIPELGSRE